MCSASPHGLPADNPGNKKAAPDHAVFDELSACAGPNRLGRMQRPNPLGAETNSARTSSICSPNSGEPAISTFRLMYSAFERLGSGLPFNG